MDRFALSPLGKTGGMSRSSVRNRESLVLETTFGSGIRSKIYFFLFLYFYVRLIVPPTFTIRTECRRLPPPSSLSAGDRHYPSATVLPAHERRQDKGRLHVTVFLKFGLRFAFRNF